MTNVGNIRFDTDASVPSNAVGIDQREFSLTDSSITHEDRLLWLRMSDQIEQIAKCVGQLEISTKCDVQEAQDGVISFDKSRRDYHRPNEGHADQHVRAIRPVLPDPRLVRRIIRQRQLRTRFFAGDLFADPAWDMLLDLTAARAEHTRVSVTSLCIASGVPPTTALRWIGQMVEAGLLMRVEDATDKRRVFIVMTDQAADAIARYFMELGQKAAFMV